LNIFGYLDKKIFRNGGTPKKGMMGGRGKRDEGKTGLKKGKKIKQNKTKQKIEFSWAQGDCGGCG